MKKRIKKDDMKSAVFITLSLILMASSLYVGLVKGRINEDVSAKNDSPSYGIEDIVKNDDVPEVQDVKDEKENVSVVNKDDGVAEDVSKTEGVSEDVVNDDEIVETAAERIILSCPVASDVVVMDFSYDTEPVYSKTFSEYRSDHTGVDYAAKEGEEVFAACEGVVSKVYEDERLGFTVAVTHDGFETRYSNLQRGIFVTEGQKVNTDTALGRVGNSAIYESQEDSHVHFSLYVDGKCVDPKEYVR